MKSVFFCVLILFHFCQSNLELENISRRKDNIQLNKPEWMTQDLIDLEYSTLKKVEAIVHPLLKEIRQEAAITREKSKNPNECIHTSAKFLTSSVNEFYTQLDECNSNGTGANTISEASSCNQKIFKAFQSTAHGAREYFKNCVANL